MGEEVVCTAVWLLFWELITEEERDKSKVGTGGKFVQKGPWSCAENGTPVARHCPQQVVTVLVWKLLWLGKLTWKYTLCVRSWYWAANKVSKQTTYASHLPMPK